ncbi:hypothetical protein D6C95_08811 [Aureobasidium pullulans]|nr:hypothetical protein D6C95_08811 [Aureobasidium pullulans]
MFNANAPHSSTPEHWNAFVNQFWMPDGKLVQHILDNTSSSTKQFAINASSLARYYWTYFDSGVQNIQLQLEGVRESALPNGGGSIVHCNRARYIFWFENNTQLIWQGRLSATFPPGSDKFDTLEFEVSKTEEFVSRSEIARIVAQGSPLMNKSPKMSRTPAKKAMQKAQGALQLEDFPAAPVNSYAVTPAVMQYLEVDTVAETIFFMKDLMDYSQKNELRPHDAMNQMVAQIEEQQQNQFQQPQNMVPNPMQPNHAQMALQRNGIVQPLPQGSGTPNQSHMQLPGQTPNFSSPSVPHMNLPMQHLNGQQMMAMNGSPHIAHPGLPGASLMAPNHMMGQMHHSPSPNMGPPMMVPQHSQQGNPNSAQQSASTSPNLSSKRRRSQVKLEGDEGLDGPPSQRMKPSPGLKKK